MKDFDYWWCQSSCTYCSVSRYAAVRGTCSDPAGTGTWWVASSGGRGAYDERSELRSGGRACLACGGRESPGRGQREADCLGCVGWHPIAEACAQVAGTSVSFPSVTRSPQGRVPRIWSGSRLWSPSWTSRWPRHPCRRSWLERRWHSPEVHPHRRWTRSRTSETDQMSCRMNTIVRWINKNRKKTFPLQFYRRVLFYMV